MSEIFDIIQFLKSAVAAGASDEHLKVGHAPYIRKNGFIKKTNMQVLTKEDVERAVMSIAPTSLFTYIIEHKIVSLRKLLRN